MCLFLFTLASVIATKRYHKVLVRFLNEKELAAREHSVIILIQTVVLDLPVDTPLGDQL